MGTILRQQNNAQNPTIPGGIYGPNITTGIPVYFVYHDNQTHFIIILCDGGKYGMSDLTLLEYKGVPLTETRFHRGTFTKQIEPYEVTCDESKDEFYILSQPFANDDPVRFSIEDGSFPAPMKAEKNGITQKFYVINAGSDDFQVSETIGGGAFDITSLNTGTLRVWKADAGWDDPEQGEFEYCPEFDSTFNNICVIEGKLSTAHSHPTNAPDWEDFRFALNGRRLMDYDADGNELGIINGDTDEEVAKLSLVPLHLIDHFLVNYKGDITRWDFTSWFDLRTRAEVEIWQRIKTDATGSIHGAVGRYYDDADFDETKLVVARTDLDINFNFGTTAPAPGMPIINYSIRWQFRQTFEFSETYTLKLDVDDTAKLFIDGTLILSTTTLGVSTVEFTAEADRVYEVQLDYKQQTSTAKIIYKWESASQSKEVVPSDFIFPFDEKVMRYGNVGFAFPTPVESSEVFERMMERLPGWDWTDDDGKITFLPPERATEFEFRFDRIDDDSIANFVYGSFKKTRRSNAERRNFLIGKGRNAIQTGYPTFYVQGDREELRKFTNGNPTNDAASDLGVCTISMAERMLEQELVIKSDPKHILNISGVRGSSKLRKNQIVKVFYYDLDGNFVANTLAKITFHGWGASNSQNDFTLLPIKENFYTDEEVTE